MNSNIVVETCKDSGLHIIKVAGGIITFCVGFAGLGFAINYGLIPFWIGHVEPDWKLFSSWVFIDKGIPAGCFALVNTLLMFWLLHVGEELKYKKQHRVALKFKLFGFLSSLPLIAVLAPTFGDIGSRKYPVVIQIMAASCVLLILYAGLSLALIMAELDCRL